MTKDSKEKTLIDNQIDAISQEDWPMLKELESTRFSLKNKKQQKINSLETLKELANKEDEYISMQNLEDEKLLDKFIESNKIESNKTILLSNNSNTIKVDSNKNNSENKELKESVENSEIKEIHTEKREFNKQKSVNSERINSLKEDTILMSQGILKEYFEKTDNILSPLGFIFENSKNILSALIQFIIPAIITWFLINEVSTINNLFAQNNTITQIVYALIFYFACFFISITIQVASISLGNLIGISFKNKKNEIRVK